jgi:hypothetical protein
VNYSLHSTTKKWNRSWLMWIAGVLVLILLSGMLIAACDTSPGINGNRNNNGQYNTDNNTNNICNGVNNCITIVVEELTQV